MPKSDEQVKKEFDKKFPARDGRELYFAGPENIRLEVLDFILSLLHEERETLRGELLRYKCGEHKRLLSLLDKK